VARRHELGSIEQRIYGQLRRLIEVRKSHPSFAGSAMQVIDPGNGHVFGFVRQGGDGRVLVLCNFSEHEQRVPANTVRANGLSYAFDDLVSGEGLALGDDLVLAPYQFVWLVAR